MNDETKNKLLQRTQRELDRGERFWPDSIYKDLLVSLGIFLLLVLLATFIGVPIQPKADPSDTTYIPRPEWYFLFLFKFLALYGQIPVLGKIEWFATVLVPGIAILTLTLMPFIDRSPNRYYGKRVLPISVMAIVVVAIVTLTLIADTPTVSPNGSNFIGILQAIGGLLIPLVGLILLFLFSFAFKDTPTRTMIWTAGLIAALMLFYDKTRIGLGMRVVHEDHVVAQNLGINVKRVFQYSWVISCMIAVVAGMLLGNIQGVGLALDANGLIAIAAVLFGGLESFAGAIIAGLAIGILQMLTISYIAPLLPGETTMMIPFVFLLVILFLKPYGLFGLVKIERL